MHVSSHMIFECWNYEKKIVLDGNLLHEFCQHNANRMILQASTRVREFGERNSSLEIKE